LSFSSMGRSWRPRAPVGRVGRRRATGLQACSASAGRDHAGSLSVTVLTSPHEVSRGGSSSTFNRNEDPARAGRACPARGQGSARPQSGAEAPGGARRAPGKNLGESGRGPP
jgi:hypothetical protein